jgi:hypothetical protein
VTIVAFTSVLMAANPSPGSGEALLGDTLTDGDYLASISSPSNPATQGPSEMHIYLSDAEISSLAQPDEVTAVEISDRGRQVAAIQIPVTRSGCWTLRPRPPNIPIRRRGR